MESARIIFFQFRFKNCRMYELIINSFQGSDMYGILMKNVNAEVGM